MSIIAPSEVAPKKRTPPSDVGQRRGRSRVTNGKALLPGDIDGRSTWVRRLRDLIELHTADLGGDDAVSEGEKSLIRRTAVLTVELERLEYQFATAGEADADSLAVYVTTANALRRILETIGLRRRQRDITPSLDQILQERAA